MCPLLGADELSTLWLYSFMMRVTRCGTTAELYGKGQGERLNQAAEMPALKIDISPSSAAPYLYAKHAKKKGPRYTDQAYIPCHSFA